MRNTAALSNTSPTRLIVVSCTPESFFHHTMALTEFQNTCTDVRQTECRFWNALRLSDFLTLMLQEVSGCELSHRALGPSVPPFLSARWTPGAPGCRQSPECYLLLCVNSSIARKLWETGWTRLSVVKALDHMMFRDNLLIKKADDNRQENKQGWLCNVFHFGQPALSKLSHSFWVFCTWGPPPLSLSSPHPTLDLILSPFYLFLLYHPASFISLFLFSHPTAPSLSQDSYLYWALSTMDLHTLQ